MRNGKAVGAALLSLALAAMLFGCAPADGFEAGRPLDQAELDSLRGELLTTQEESSGEATEPSDTDTATDTETTAEEEPPTESVTDGETAPAEIETTPEETETAPAETAPAEDTAESETTESETVAVSGKVYWTKSGSVYHKDRDCYHLKKSQSVSEGSVEQAVSLGKERLCASCEKKTSP
jgi:outer membrane biosynthesis protein TonB